MRKRMEPLEVMTNDDGQIEIVQERNEIAQRILLAPEQAALVARWLTEAAEELTGDGEEADWDEIGEDFDDE